MGPGRALSPSDTVPSESVHRAGVAVVADTRAWLPARIAAYLDGYRIEQVLNTGVVGASTTLHTDLALWRSDRERPFSEDERCFMATAFPHLIEACTQNRLLHLVRSATPRFTGPWRPAAADSTGLLHHVDSVAGAFASVRCHPTGTSRTSMEPCWHSTEWQPGGHPTSAVGLDARAEWAARIAVPTLTPNGGKCAEPAKQESSDDKATGSDVRRAELALRLRVGGGDIDRRRRRSVRGRPDLERRRTCRNRYALVESGAVAIPSGLHPVARIRQARFTYDGGAGAMNDPSPFLNQAIRAQPSPVPPNVTVARLRQWGAIVTQGDDANRHEPSDETMNLARR